MRDALIRALGMILKIGMVPRLMLEWMLMIPLIALAVLVRARPLRALLRTGRLRTR